MIMACVNLNGGIYKLIRCKAIDKSFSQGINMMEYDIQNVRGLR